VHVVTTGGRRDVQFDGIDARRVDRTGRLRGVQLGGERPGVDRDVVELALRKDTAVHEGGDGVVIHVGHILRVSDAVHVEGGLVEGVLVSPVGIGGFRVDEVERAARMVKVGEVEFRVSIRRDLVLGLGDEELVFILHEKVSLRSVQENELAVHARGGGRREIISALDFNLDRVVLHGDEWEASREITVTEEERNKVVVG